MKYSDDNHLEREPTLIIYCKEWCEYLQKLVNLLRAKQQAFTFIDLRFDTKQAKALISELGNPLILPVLFLNGIYHEKPPISKVKSILDQYQWRQQVDQKYYGTLPAQDHQ
ncbi:glutaredoxin family protein [Halalkalibaculum sp. DA3122]|uniref:glutaredoxin family protein n=1 Tax=Halalkalibaculum sp. DA3122 TaxID=3373607 RepID=UPI0037543911